MKRFFIAALLAACFAPAALAQTTYSLFDLSEDDFADGNTAPWSFEMYTKGDGQFEELPTFGTASMANYLDIYNPERLAGERITEIDGVTVNGTNTWASNLRPSRYMQEYTSPVTALDLVYVCQDLREGFGYEFYGTASYSSTITFEIPATGYYSVSGTIMREDHPDNDPLVLKAVYRYATQEEDVQQGDMGISIVYGSNGGVLDDYDGNAHINNGATQRYIEEEPTDFTLAFNAQAGDKIAFIVDSLSYNDRECWARSFMQQLTITLTDEETAQADANYVDPYDDSALVALLALIDSLYDIVIDYELGTAIGQYPVDAVDEFYMTYDEIYEALQDGTINAMNAAYYMEQFLNAFASLQAQQVNYDYTLEGNYRLFYNTGTYDYTEGSSGYDNLTVNYDSDDFLYNNDAPWGFYAYTEGTGTYSAFGSHDTGNKAGALGWYRSSSEYLYILDQGVMHALTATTSPAIVFTAELDGVYKVYFDAYAQEGEGNNLNRYLRLTSRYMASDQSDCDSSIYIMRDYYGNADGYSGYEPAVLEYFVNLKAGDKLTFEVAAPTRNSSGSTQVMNLTICSRIDDETVLTSDSATASGVYYYDPYGIGDLTELQALMEEAKALIDAIGDNYGDGDGQYGASEMETMLTTYAEADSLCNSGTASQVDIDLMMVALQDAYDALSISRLGYHIQPIGNYSIRVNSTGQYLSQAYAASSIYFYAGFYTYDELDAYATKNEEAISDMNWTFCISDTYDSEDEDGYAISVTSDTKLYITVPNGGWLTQDGYVSRATDSDPDNHTFEFYTEEEGDSLFAIRRADGAYWLGSFTWSSPYDKVDTTDTPQYIFVVDETTLESAYEEAVGITDISSSATLSPVVRTDYFTLDGRRTTASAPGFVIIRQVRADGSATLSKVLNR